MEAPDAPAAVDIGTHVILPLAEKAGLPLLPVVRAEAVREDVLDADNAAPMWPDLVSAPEVAEILGTSSQRVHVLAAQNKRFPRPACELRTGKVWVRAASRSSTRNGSGSRVGRASRQPPRSVIWSALRAAAPACAGPAFRSAGFVQSSAPMR